MNFGFALFYFVLILYLIMVDYYYAKFKNNRKYWLSGLVWGLLFAEYLFLVFGIIL